MNKFDIKEFSLLLQREKFVLADFYADWCEPCKLLDIILMEVQNKLGEKIFIEKFDVDVSKKLSEFYEVKSVPVLIFFKNREVVWRMNGFLTANELIKIFEKILIA